MVKEIIRKIRKLEIKGALLTFEGYAVVAEAECGRLYNFLIKGSRSVMLETEKGWKRVPRELAEVIEDKFVHYSVETSGTVFFA